MKAKIYKIKSTLKISDTLNKNIISSWQVLIILTSIGNIFPFHYNKVMKSKVTFQYCWEERKPRVNIQNGYLVLPIIK